MATKKKLLQAAAGQAAGGAALNVEDVFSTYLYEGNGSTQTITNGIDLDGEGGLVWTKDRDTAVYHALVDTERGGQNMLVSSETLAQTDRGSDFITSFKSDGYSIGADGLLNDTNNYASWTFRKAPKFFDVVTWTGDGTGARTISHDLGATVGALFMKATNAEMQWFSYHNGLTNQQFLELNATTAAVSSVNAWNNTTPTSTEFSVGSYGNVSGRTYVAYLFAHNDGDGEFGPDGDADIIKCGSYTGNGSNDGPEIDLGFEPQWLMVKAASASGDWKLYDSMRGLNASGASDYFLEPNTTDIEDLGNYYAVTPTGFKLTDNTFFHNSSGSTYIYIAIRRGTKVPESADEVFDVQFNGGNDPSKAPVYQSGFVTDMAIVGYRTGGSVNYPYTGNRLMGIQTLETHNTDAEESGGSSFQWDFMNGFIDSVPSVITDTQIAWMWKRAPGYFDVVAYSGTGVAGRTVSHNLGVAPEMMWIKCRNTGSTNWSVYAAPLGNTSSLSLNQTSAAFTGVTNWNSTTPTATEFTLGSNLTVNNSASQTYIAYLFASLDGISKVGSYTGTGSAQTIDCGFTTGARFVLIKKASGTGDWIVHDTERGITAIGSADPWLELNTTTAENTSFDVVYADSSGFGVTTFNDWNESGHSYIFYAIA